MKPVWKKQTLRDLSTKRRCRDSNPDPNQCSWVAPALPRLTAPLWECLVCPGRWQGAHKQGGIPRLWSQQWALLGKKAVSGFSLAVARLDDHNLAFNSSCELRKACGHLWSVRCHWTHTDPRKEDGSSHPFLLLPWSQVCRAPMGVMAKLSGLFEIGLNAHFLDLLDPMSSWTTL